MPPTLHCISTTTVLLPYTIQIYTTILLSYFTVQYRIGKFLTIVFAIVTLNIIPSHFHTKNIWGCNTCISNHNVLNCSRCVCISGTTRQNKSHLEKALIFLCVSNKMGRHYIQLTPIPNECD